MLRDQFRNRQELPNYDLTPDRAHFAKYTPSANTEYYNEAALTSKSRRELPDSEFGVPRLRAYPLHDASHVKQAVRMFNHCKDPEDQKTLAKNIVKAARKHNVKLQVSKKNALYNYLPHSMQEAASFGMDSLGASNVQKTLGERTKSEITAEHLRLMGPYLNNIFYGVGYANSVKAIKEYSFLDYFYPALSRISFAIRLRMVCGGLAVDEGAEEVYPVLGMRKPLDKDLAKDIGWTKDADKDQLRNTIIANYASGVNWLRVDLSDDLDHIYFCLRLYSIMAKIILDPSFNPEIHLDQNHQAVLMDWGQRVQYHYDLLKEALNEDEETEQAQYLWDLFWNYTDSPMDPNVQSHNIIHFLRSMASVENQGINMNEANIPGELISKEQCSAYLTKELGLPDSIYLLPDKLEYPIIDKNSVHLAMDKIRQIDKEDRTQYANNLNRMYRELGCTFQISVDHPYARWADKNIIMHMTQVLMEGDTAVDDEGTSLAGEPGDRVAAPPHKKVEFIRGYFLKNLADKPNIDPPPSSKSDRSLKDQDDSLN